jgi:hypothetical protein
MPKKTGTCWAWGVTMEDFPEEEVLKSHFHNWEPEIAL